MIEGAAISLEPDRLVRERPGLLLGGEQDGHHPLRLRRHLQGRQRIGKPLGAEDLLHGVAPLPVGVGIPEGVLQVLHGDLGALLLRNAVTLQVETHLERRRQGLLEADGPLIERIGEHQRAGVVRRIFGPLAERHDQGRVELAGEDPHDGVEECKQGLPVLARGVLQKRPRRLPVVGIGAGDPAVEDVGGGRDDRPQIIPCDPGLLQHLLRDPVRLVVEIVLRFGARALCDRYDANPPRHTDPSFLNKWMPCNRPKERLTRPYRPAS